MMKKIATGPVRRALLAVTLLFLSASLLALRASPGTSRPSSPVPTATVQPGDPNPPAGAGAFRMITALPAASGSPSPGAAALGEAPAGPATAIAAGQPPLPSHRPAPSATPWRTALPGAGSDNDRPERLASGSHDADQGRQSPAEPQPLATPSPTAQILRPPTRIAAPAIGLDASIVPVGWKWIRQGNARVAQWQVPKNKVGWHNTSALAGQAGNTVLSGHRNLYSEVFRYLPDLEPGDEITLYAGNDPYVYVVAEKHIVKEVGVPQSARYRNARWIAPSGDVRLTLVTCAPYEAPGNTHRVIVVARLRDSQT